MTELQCLTAFVELGYIVSIPYGDCAKYDFIVDVNGKLLKVQVKTAHKHKNVENAIVFSCRSTHTNSKGVSNVRYSQNEIDYFATYWGNKCYVVPISECSTEKTLRLASSKNNQQAKISFASEYEIDKRIKQILAS